MFGKINWFFDNWAEITVGTGLLFAFVKFVVDKTPTKKDDAQLARIEKALIAAGLLEDEKK